MLFSLVRKLIVLFDFDAKLPATFRLSEVPKALRLGFVMDSHFRIVNIFILNDRIPL
jgi:hypothetical protein